MHTSDHGATDWRDEKHDEVFGSTLTGLERRRHSDTSFRLADAEGTLAHLYVQDGNDQGGRGELQDIVLAAMIAAHEHFIAEWKRELEAASSEQEQQCP